jgi:hypothetical protein
MTSQEKNKLAKMVEKLNSYLKEMVDRERLGDPDVFRGLKELKNLSDRMMEQPLDYVLYKSPAHFGNEFDYY